MKETPPTPAAAAAHPMAVQVGHLPPSDAVSALVEHACKQRMSDLFFTTDDNSVGILGRHLGVMQVVSRLTADQGRRCIAHIKALANMDMTERRRPTDGRWVFRRGDDDVIDLRINALPTLHGEDMTLCILDRQNALTGPGPARHVAARLQSTAELAVESQRPHSGYRSDGRGKTTTLYACLGHLNNGHAS